MRWKATLVTVMLGGVLLLGGATAAQARDCFERVRREERNLRRDVARHGFYSRQAEHRRHELREERARCGFERRHDGRWNDHDRRDRWHRRW